MMPDDAGRGSQLAGVRRCHLGGLPREQEASGVVGEAGEGGAGGALTVQQLHGRRVQVRRPRPLLQGLREARQELP